MTRASTVEKVPLAIRERLAVNVGRSLNSSPGFKSVARWMNLAVTYPIVRVLSGSRVHVLGLDRVAFDNAARGVLIAPNHRSFFDLYLVMAQIAGQVRRAKRLYFPVRSNFWYDSTTGIAVNTLVCAMSMYPPIFRAADKRHVTRAGLDFLSAELQRAGTIAGMHPEGTRSRGDAPYELLPAEQSFGRVVLKGKPLVVPVFVNGVGNSLLRECVDSIRGRAAPIVIVFGAPVELGEFEHHDPERLRSQIEVGRRVLKSIAELAEEERQYRAKLG